MMKDSERVALFLSYLGGGGAERVMLNLASGLVEQGLQVDLVLSKAWGPHLWKVPKSVNIVDLGASRPIASLPPLVNYLKRKKPLALLSAMHYANEIAVLAKRFAGVSTRIIVSEHNTLSKTLGSGKNLKKRLIPFCVRYVYPHADEIVAVSKGAAKDLVNMTSLPEERIHAVYNPVITQEIFEKAAAPVDHPWFQPGELPVILGIGKLEAQKDFPNLIQAFAQVRKSRPCRLAILGWGPDQPQLEALICDFGLEQDAALLGYVDNPYAYMSKAAMFVLSSAWEGLPTVLIEAMAVGIPVVSTDCPSGPQEILDGGRYGHLVPPGNSQALAEGILEVLNGKGKPVDSNWLHQFTTKASVQHYLNLFSNI